MVHRVMSSPVSTLDATTTQQVQPTPSTKGTTHLLQLAGQLKQLLVNRQLLVTWWWHGVVTPGN